MVTKSAVIGIDLGSSDSYVAFVGKGIVDIVQNEVSKRATPSLVGFTDRERLLGDAALSQIRSNSKNTCRNFKHLLGRKLEAPDLEKEKFWSTSPLVATDDGYIGYDVTYKGESRQVSATEVAAMYFTKLKDITEGWCQAKVADAVIAVPSSFSDEQRQAVLDAAKVAGISVLRIMNEHTATALAYGIYRSNDFDPEKPITVAFCSVGHAIFSVSVVQFVRGKLTVLCEKSEKVGGRDMDECLMREFAAQFKKKVGCDPLSNKKAAFKLEDAVMKTKKTLSANSEAPVTVECLMEDEDFASNINRTDFETMCQPMMDRVKAVLESAKAAYGMPVETIDAVEIVGGACRVPWMKSMISEAFGGKELSTTMNQEESVSRGCALQAAILSPLYKVRDFKVEDSTAFGVSVGWMGSAADAEAAKDDDGDTQMGGGEGEYKTATVFPEKSVMNVLKLLTFYRKGPFDIKAEYVDEKLLPPLSKKELGTYHIELPAQQETKKVKVKAKLTLHGTFSLEGAQLVEEEEYEETVREKRELPPDAEVNGDAADAAAEKPASPKEASEAKEAEGDAKMDDATEDAEKANGTPSGAEGTAENGKAAEKTVPEKKYEWVDVVKQKKRVKHTDIPIKASGTPGLSLDTLQKLMDAETAMIADTKEIVETDEKRNDLEAYILTMRDKVSSSGEYGEFISDADREKFTSELQKSEDWLYDNFDANKVQYIDKLDELKSMGDVVVWRFKESGMREEWMQAVSGTIRNYREAAENPGDKYGHIAGEKLAKITAACNDLEKWLSDLKSQQEKKPKTEKPVLICADMEKKNQELAKMADEVLKEPKPAPPKEEKKAEEPKADEKKDEQNGDAAKETPADGPAEGDAQNMDVD